MNLLNQQMRTGLCALFIAKPGESAAPVARAGRAGRRVRVKWGIFGQSDSEVLGEGPCDEVRECFVAQGDKLQTAESEATYAVKILKCSKARHKHMQNEITALRRAQHPHCIKLVDVYMEDVIYMRTHSSWSCSRQHGAGSHHRDRLPLRSRRS